MFYPYNQKIQEIINKLINEESLVNLLKYEYDTNHYPILIIEKLKFLLEEQNIHQSTDSTLSKEISSFKKWIKNLNKTQKNNLSQFLNLCQTGDYGINELTELIIDPCKYETTKSSCKRVNPRHTEMYHNKSNSNHIANILIQML